MKLACNARNLRKFSKDLLGNNFTPEAVKALRRECLKGFVRDTTPGGRPFGHISHDRSAHLDRIGNILGTFGTEGMVLDRHGNDLSGTCSGRGVALDVQYCNAGETYALTILYVNGRLCIGDWGSLVERLS